MNILIVESDLPLLETMKQICDEENYTSRLAQNPDQARKFLIGGFLPDLIICDEFVPQLLGREWQRELIAHDEWKKIPFVMMKSRKNQDNIVLPMELVKPFSIEDILELFRKVRLSSQTRT